MKKLLRQRIERESEIVIVEVSSHKFKALIWKSTRETDLTCCLCIGLRDFGYDCDNYCINGIPISIGEICDELARTKNIRSFSILSIDEEIAKPVYHKK